MAIAASEPVIAWQAHEGRRVARVAGYDIIQCDLCGFRHVLPLPDPTEIEAARRKANIKEETLAFPPQNGDDRAWAELAYNDRLESMERLLGAQRRRLLDIGSGTGSFLKTAKSRGWRVFGIESSRQASAQARKAGIEVAEGFFNAGNRARTRTLRRGPSQQRTGMRARSDGNRDPGTRSARPGRRALHQRTERFLAVPDRRARRDERG
jgi:hypothetical protein